MHLSFYANFVGSIVQEPSRLEPFVLGGAGGPVDSSLLAILLFVYLIYLIYQIIVTSNPTAKTQSLGGSSLAEVDS